MRTFGDMGRGVVADSLVAGDDVLFVPAAVVLSRQTATSAGHRELVELFKDSSSELSVMILLLYERALGDRSYFRPYLQVLPAYVPSLVHYSRYVEDFDTI